MRSTVRDSGMAGALVCLLILGMLVTPFGCREKGLEPSTLFEKATAATSSRRDALDAIRALAELPGPDADSFLLHIAKGDVEATSALLQIEAVRAIASRGVPGSSAALASLIVPQTSFEVRREVVAAVRMLGCDVACMKSVLHFLERSSWGEQTPEERLRETLEAAETPAEVIDELEKIQEDASRRFKDELYALVRDNSEAALTVLIDTYGFRTGSPSSFGVQLAVTADLREACPALVASKRTRDANSLRSAMPELDAALISLECD